MFTFQSQLFRHRPEEGVWGDCHRTCIANILALHPSEVPHEHRDMTGDEFRDQMNGYLATRGLTQVSLWWPQSINYILSVHVGLNPNLHFILSGRTKREIDHSVLCIGGFVVKNPSLDADNDLVAPGPDEQYQTTYLMPVRAAFQSEEDFIEAARGWRLESVLV